MALVPDSAFVDGFPCDPAHPDYAIQAVIDSDLRNCLALKGTSTVTMGLLYPAYFAASREERETWVEPALRRFAWNATREPWNDYLRRLLDLLVTWPTPPISEAGLLLLAQLGPQLTSNDAVHCQVGQAIAARLKERKEPLTPELVGALQTLVAHLVDMPGQFDRPFYIAWRLWRAPENLHDGAPCFSARVRADLRAMPNEQADAWCEFLNLRSENPPFMSLEEPYCRTLRAAVSKIGRDCFASLWMGWIDWMEANQPAVLSPVGRDLLLAFLHTCGSVPELSMDDSLYQLCGVRWAGTGNLTRQWLGALLVTLATRPAEKAFACAERLVHNPDTSSFVEVHKLYNQLLAELADEATQPRQLAGVDGYELMCQPELYRHQVILDRAIRDAVPGQSGPPGVVQTTWDTKQMMIPLLVRRQAGTDHANFVRAVASRVRWLKDNSKPNPVTIRQTPLGEIGVCRMDPYLLWRSVLDQIQRVLLAAAPTLGHDDLVSLIETAGRAGALGSSGALVSNVAAYIKENGYSLTLVKAMEGWYAALQGSQCPVEWGHEVGWLLWLEDVAPIREEDCWSQRIRKDVRQMHPASRTAWRTILENTFLPEMRSPGRPSAEIVKAGLAGVSAEEFRSQVRLWFEPFRAEEPLHLTFYGRCVLRNLMWCALLAKDPGVDEALTWFASAEWRDEQDQRRSEAILPAFVSVMLERSEALAYASLETLHRKGKVQFRGALLQQYQELCVRLGRTPSAQTPLDPPPTAQAGVIRQILKRFEDLSEVRAENDRLIVSGVKDSYEIDVRDSRIVRRSDGRAIRLELDFSKPLFASLRSGLDSQDLADPFRPNYFRLMISVRVLIHDDINADSIVADND